MNYTIDKIKFKLNSLPRIARLVISGFIFMILGVFLSRYNPNIIYFIFAGCFSLLGLVLFMMGVINGFIDIYRTIKNKIPSSKVN